VCLRRAKVPVDYDHRDQDRHDVHDEREQKVLGNERNADRRRRQDLRHEEQKDDKRKKD